MLDNLAIDIDRLMPVIESLAVNLLFAVVLLVVGWMVSSFIGRNVRKLALKSTRIDPTIIPMIHTVAVWAIRVFVVLAILARFGVQTASIIAVLGAAGLAIGLALQGTLQNIAAGIMLLALRPLRAGEFISVVGKADGTVDEVGLFLTRLIQSDGIHISLPNSLVWGSPIINYSRNNKRRMDIEVAVRYGDDLELAIRKLGELVNEHPNVLKEPAPLIFVSGYKESSTTVNMRAWASVQNYWDVNYELNRRALQVLSQAGLQMPVPLREITTRATLAGQENAAD
ncbi:MAG: mechanosensitive ion channel family protein [Alcaligenaceae bacterium]|nr:mechanosensitive ion channel family protein [Alcaligenaceae bacterium]